MIRRRSTPAWLMGFALASGLALAPWAAPASPGRGDDDDDEKQYALALNRQAFAENCLMCHGEDMTSRQRLTPKQWAAEVEKMVGWGAPLPPDRKQPLIDFLAEAYPTAAPSTTPDRIDPAAVAALDRQDTPIADGPVAHADAARGAALFASHCASCHGAEARGGEIGINLVARPILAREGDFRAILREGRRRMPGFAPALDAEGPAQLLAWLRGRR